VKQLNNEKSNGNWVGNMHGRLALIILCDQFSRSIYRKQKKAFELDHIS
jgi:uncharacterized protein (DUF924 family)